VPVGEKPALFIFPASTLSGNTTAAAPGTPLYQVLICGPTASVTTDVRFRMEVSHGLDALDTAQIVIVPPTLFPDEVPPEVLDALCLARSCGRRILSLCTGASVLAAAGMLDGLTATTHWSECADLARRYPRVRVDPGVL
jgi:AraC family transcriptional regulator, transcriptional activator FtrA